MCQYIMTHEVNKMFYLKKKKKNFGFTSRYKYINEDNIILFTLKYLVFM